jgi:hypothetical protein
MALTQGAPCSVTLISYEIIPLAGKAIGPRLEFNLFLDPNRHANGITGNFQEGDFVHIFLKCPAGKPRAIFSISKCGTYSKRTLCPSRDLEVIGNDLRLFGWKNLGFLGDIETALISRPDILIQVMLIRQMILIHQQTRLIVEIE